MSQPVVMSCHCVATSVHTRAHDGLPERHPSCITHDNCTVATQAPDLIGRQAKVTWTVSQTKMG